MDRNLGATLVADSITHSASYGDLYQWGRDSDGHQNRIFPDTTSILSTSDRPGHEAFIKVGIYYDWRSPSNDALWQGVNSINNPCPAGYRLPTDVEWEAERISWSSNDAAEAISSPLKLPLKGYREDQDGTLLDEGSEGYYWSSTVDGTYSRALFFASDDAGAYMNLRSFGNSLRSLKD
ncbi:MAG: hypothetical protein ACI9FN_003277 [Saprospiraceae bacterium]|jgi:hypothetical protein